MKLFIYKTLLIFLLIYLLFQLTIGLVVKKIKKEIYNFKSKENKNNYEGDYYGLSTSKAISQILRLENDENNRIINIGVASHTPLQRGIDFIDINKKDLIRIVGQEFNSAKYIYKNNISEVDINYNKKYNIPGNFAKIDELIVDEIIIYEIYKNTKMQ